MKTRRVRVLIAITDDGYYIAEGTGDSTPKQTVESLNEVVRGNMTPPIHYYWIEADVPVPAKLKPSVLKATRVRRAA